MIPRQNNFNFPINNQINPISNNINQNQLNRNINNSNNNRLNQNERIILLSENSNKFFIVSFYPNKTVCFTLLLLNIIICGTGTLLLGFKNSSFYEVLLGIIQFFGCFTFFIKGIDTEKTHYLFDIKVNKFSFYYLICTSLLFYLSSIYIGIFHNFIFFNVRITKMNENKKKGICIILLNLITGGLGTLLYGFLMKNIDCLYRLKVWFFGIVQVCGFIILVLGFSLIGNINKIIDIILILVGFMGYITSIAIGIKFYKKISVS